MSLDTFAPQGNNVTVNVPGTVSSARVAFGAHTDPGVSVGDVRIYNAAATAAFVEFGNSSVTASLTTSIPIAAGAVEILRANGSTHVAAILPSSTGTVYFTPGRGI